MPDNQFGLSKAIYSVKETCQLIGCCATTFYALLHENKIKATKRGKRTVVLAGELAAYLKSLQTTEWKPYTPVERARAARAPAGSHVVDAATVAHLAAGTFAAFPGEPEPDVQPTPLEFSGSHEKSRKLVDAKELKGMNWRSFVMEMDDEWNEADLPTRLEMIIARGLDLQPYAATLREAAGILRRQKERREHGRHAARPRGSAAHSVLGPV